jgi:hypothetical protein
VCHDTFINLANTENDLLFGTLVTSIEAIFVDVSTTTPLGVSTVGSIILMEVGVPNSYLVILEFYGINTLTVVPLASTLSISGHIVKSIVPIRPLQF